MVRPSRTAASTTSMKRMGPSPILEVSTNRPHCRARDDTLAHCRRCCCSMWNRLALGAFVVFLKCAQRELKCAQADLLANVPSLRHLQEDAVGASPAAGCGGNPPSDLGAGTARLWGLAPSQPRGGLMTLGSFPDEAHDHVDIGNLEVLGRLRQTIDANRTAGDIDEPPLGLHEEVVVIGNVGVEIGALSTDSDLAQQPRALELVQGVVNGGQGNLFARRHRLLVKDFGGHMTVTIAKQQSRQGHALTRRPQVCPPQQRPYLDPPRFGSPCQTTHSRPPGLSPAGTLGRSHLPKRRTAFMPSSYISICWSSTPRNDGRVVLALGSSGSRSRGEFPRKSPCAPVQRPSFETVIETHIEAPTARAARNAGF